MRLLARRSAALLPTVLHALEKRSPVFTVLVSLLTIAAITVADWLTGSDLAVSIFYLAPILLVTDRLGGGPGMVVALLCTASWLAADRAVERIGVVEWVHYWNAVVRFGFFSITILLVTALKREHRLARRDFLTGIANRQALVEHLEAEIERARRYGRAFSFALLDIDRFKAVNDTRGHDAGDRRLRDVAAALSANTRGVDVIARFGGDEFAVLLPETGVEAAVAVARRIQAGLRALVPPEHSGATLSIGLITFLEPSAGVDEVIKRADAALYGAKHAGGNAIQHEVVG